MKALQGPVNGRLANAEVAHSGLEGGGGEVDVGGVAGLAAVDDGDDDGAGGASDGDLLVADDGGVVAHGDGGDEGVVRVDDAVAGGHAHTGVVVGCGAGGAGGELLDGGGEGQGEGGNEGGEEHLERSFGGVKEKVFEVVGSESEFCWLLREENV